MTPLYAQCIPYNESIKGRIGGNPPINIETEIPEGYAFYATLVHPEKENKMLSILISNDFEILIENNIYPSIAVKVIEHKYSEMGSDINKAITSLSVNSITDYKEIQDDDFQFIKVGGEPRFIQYKDYYYEELEKEFAIFKCPLGDLDTNGITIVANSIKDFFGSALGSEL